MTPAGIRVGFWILEGLLLWLARRPASRAFRLLCAPHGPRTDVSAMNRHQLFQSGGAFLAVGAAFLLAGCFEVVTLRNSMDESVPLMTLFVFLMFPGLMGIGGGLYLLVRGVFRYPAPEPPNPRSPIEPR